MDFNHWLLFASIAFIATITPGPAIFLATTNSLSYGAKNATISILGNITGLFIMALLSVLGLSAIILNSAPIFFAVKFVGSLYLIYLGVRIWKNGLYPSEDPTEKAVKAKPPKPYKLYIQGLFVALSNPKAIAFTTALFPQFIQPELALAPQFMILIITFMFLSFSSLLAFALMADKSKKHTRSKRWQKTIGRLFGGVFIASGLLLATANRQ